MPLLVDLYCGAGGAATGYSRAGFDVVGVDIRMQSRYPYPFIQADALEFLQKYLDDGADLMEEPVAFHASPPCQRYSSITGRWGWGTVQEHPDLVGITRELLEATDLPYVIENVEGAPLRQPICLCGRSFGLEVRRHRLFEISDFDIDLIPPCACGGSPALQVNGHPGGSSTRDPKARFGSTAEWSEGMGIDWMTGAEMAEAIPPAYTEFIGEHLLAHLKQTPSVTLEFTEAPWGERDGIYTWPQLPKN